MNVQLKVVTRENWEEALQLQVCAEQKRFVPSVAVSLAKVYIKPDGDHVEYVPLAIYDQDTIIGFIMHAFEKDTSDMYWINGFIIDKKYQGNGYGKATLKEIVTWITNQFSQCEEIRLTVHKENVKAKKLYENFGFIDLGYMYNDEQVYCLRI